VNTSSISNGIDGTGSASPATPVLLSDLSPDRRRLVRLCAGIRFGRVGPIPVRRGEPVLERQQQVHRTVKLGGKVDPRPAGMAGDYALRAGVLELLVVLDRVGDGVVERIEVADGTPVLVEVREWVRA
jgi:hypothetical protein